MPGDHSPASSAEVKSVIQNESPWRAKVSSLGEDRDLIALRVRDTSGILIADARGKLHKSTDFGETWQSSSINLTSSSKLSSIDFVDPLLGWAVSVKQPADVLDSQGFESSILSTNDGGLNWHVQFGGKGLNLNRIVFANDLEGWAVGTRLVQKEAPENEVVVLHTGDQGKSWTDVSGALRRLSKGGVVEDIYAAQSSRAVVLTSAREILSTEDAGQSWRLVSTIQGKSPQLSTFRIGMLLNNNIWVLGATGGREGTWSLLAVGRDRDQFVKHKIDQVLLRDSIFLSDSEVVACGTIASNAEVPLLDDAHRNGVILRSTDGGSTWTIIYRDLKAKSINAIAAGAGGYLWAVGEAGLVVQLANNPDPR